MHVPNHIPSATRIKYVVLSSVLIAYGAFGIVIDDLYLPGKRGPGVHLHGVPAWVLYCAMLAASANMASVVIDHYDKRPNERNYTRFAFWSEVIAWGLVSAAVVCSIYL